MVCFMDVENSSDVLMSDFCCLTAWLGNTPRDCRHRQRKTDEL